MISSHDPSLNLIRSVLESEAFGHSLMRGLKAEYFWDKDYGKVWSFILDHWKDYGKVPDMETVLASFPKIAPLLLRVRAVEPPEYYADKIIEGYVRTGIATRLTETAPKLGEDVPGTLAEIRDIIGEYDLIQGKTAILTMADTGRERLEIYKQTDIFGVPFPWPTLEKATMGMQKGDLVGDNELLHLKFIKGGKTVDDPFWRVSFDFENSTVMRSRRKTEQTQQRLRGRARTEFVAVNRLMLKHHRQTIRS